jgi:hypothetical protein
MQNDPFVRAAVQRLNMLLDLALPVRLEPAVHARVERIAAATAARQRDLVLALERGEIALETYVREFRQLVTADFLRLDWLLGRKAFLALFDAPPEAAARTIDPRAFASAHGLTPRA